MNRSWKKHPDARTGRRVGCRAVAASAILTCAFAAPPPFPGAAAPSADAQRWPERFEVERGRMQVGPLERSFLFYTPPELPPNPAAVLVFHGAGGDGSRIRGFVGREVERLARERGFVVVYPDGYGGHWNDCRATAPYPAKRRDHDEIAFVRELIRWLGARYGLDHGRVGAIGFSNGAHLVFRLALEIPDEVQAVAAFGANLPVAEELDCEVAGSPVPVMLANGTADPINPYHGGPAVGPDGGALGQVRSSRETAEYLATLGVGGTVAVREEVLLPRLPDGSTVELSVWSRPGAPEVALYTVVGGGHVIPGVVADFPDFLGPVERRFDAIAEAVRFFERHSAVAPSRSPDADPGG